VRDWYLTNNLLLNAKSEVIVLGTANQLRLATTVDSVEVAGATLPVAPTLKSLGVILDQCLTFDDHATAVVKTCNFHIRAIRHVRHLLPESTALTLGCSLMNSRLDYCNALLYGAPASTISKLQRLQNNAARVVLAASRRCDAKPLLRQLRCDDAEGSHDRCSSLPQRTCCPTRRHPPDTFCCTSTAGCPEDKY